MNRMMPMMTQLMGAPAGGGLGLADGARSLTPQSTAQPTGAHQGPEAGQESEAQLKRELQAELSDEAVAEEWARIIVGDRSQLPDHRTESTAHGIGLSAAYRSGSAAAGSSSVLSLM